MRALACAPRVKPGTETLSQLLWGKQKGAFAAPPEWSKQRSPWAVIPIWLMLPLTIFFIAYSFPPLLGFYSCSELGSPTCVGMALPDVRDGTLKAIAVFTGLMMFVGLAMGLMAAIRLKRWPVWLCWLMAAIGFLLAVLAFLMLAGSLPTPVGQVIPRSVSTG